MTPLADVRLPHAPAPAHRRRGLLPWVCTNNPFYVLSAGLFLAGLWLSFGSHVDETDTWALMSGLAGYTLLLAATALLLVRYAHVWDDVRTVLLLVVLMFLATSVTFDDVLVLDPGRGFACYLGGLLFAVAVTEGLLRGIRLALPALFRAPYYLVLVLFFLYPLALRPFVGDPRGEELTWGLFGFSTAAGLAFLTLLPAIRRGPDYVRDNGSPWRWPLYPWVLFGVLAFAVPGRAYLLCRSLHLLESGGLHQLMFGPYFLVPFGLALAVLLLEIGLVGGHRGVLRTTLLAPAALVVLTLVGHRSDRVYQAFLQTFSDRLGGDPLSVTLWAAAAFYVYAAVRRVPHAFGAFTAALAAVAFVGPQTMTTRQLAGLSPVPLLAAGALQLAMGIRRRDSWQCLIGSGVFVAALLAVPAGPALALPRAALALHLALLALLCIGAAFDDALARRLRVAGAALGLLASLAVTFGGLDSPPGVPAWLVAAYPLSIAAILMGYGLVLRHRTSQAASGLIVAVWMVAVGWRGYCWLRQLIAGLDHLVLSLALFAVAVLISLGKSGVLARWVAIWRGALPPPGPGTGGPDAPVWPAGGRA
jgi:hypothetical protein